MNLLEKYTKGWSFRSNHPTFDVGDEITVFVTNIEDGVQLARIGDTKLRLPDAPGGLIDKRVRLHVTEFDDENHVGEAEYLETVGESAF